MSEPDDPASSPRIIKAILGVTALGTLLTGFVLYLFSDAFGIDPDTASLMAIIFLTVGVLDYLVLVFWDRIFPPR